MSTQKEVRYMGQGEFIVVLGGFTIMMGVFDVLGSDDESSWKGPATKIGLGLIIVVVGLLMKHFGM